MDMKMKNTMKQAAKRYLTGGSFIILSDEQFVERMMYRFDCSPGDAREAIETARGELNAQIAKDFVRFVNGEGN